MPEGDSILRIARALGPRLVDRTIERATTQGLAREAIAGKKVVSIAPFGKHLVIELEGGTHVRVHMGINGRQRTYGRAEGEKILARYSPGRVSLALVTADTVAMWINQKTVEVSDRRAPRHGMAVAELGPDVLADGFDPEIAAERAAVYEDRTIADVLLDQRVAAGIGNIWKCEALFACGVDPRRRVKELDRATLAALYASARHQMLDNLNRPRAAQQFAVYSRTNQTCGTCGAPIDRYQLGDQPRWTWSCPRCQPAGAVAGASR